MWVFIDCFLSFFNLSYLCFLVTSLRYYSVSCYLSFTTPLVMTKFTILFYNQLVRVSLKVYGDSFVHHMSCFSCFLVDQLSTHHRGINRYLINHCPYLRFIFWNDNVWESLLKFNFLQDRIINKYSHKDKFIKYY